MRCTRIHFRGYRRLADTSCHVDQNILAIVGHCQQSTDSAEATQHLLEVASVQEFAEVGHLLAGEAGEQMVLKARHVGEATGSRSPSAHEHADVARLVARFWLSPLTNRSTSCPDTPQGYGT